MKIVNGEAYLSSIRQLIIEYTMMLGRDLGFQNLDEELQDLKQKYGGNKGRLLAGIAEDGTLAGCVAYHRLDDGCCEMKRLYVKPVYRHSGMGRQLAEAILLCAKQDGYSYMVLDTIEPLTSAIHLYEHLGFQRIDAYYDNPMADVIYMGKQL